MLLADFDDSGDWRDDGARSAASWVTARTRSEGSRAAWSAEALGRFLRRLPALRAALLEGRGSLRHISILRDAATKSPHRLAAVEDFDEMAARIIGTLTPHEFRVAVERWAALVDEAERARRAAEGDDWPDPEPDTRIRRTVTLSQYGADGLWALDGTLTAEAGAALAAALDAAMDAMRGADDGRTLSQRRHDALQALVSGELSAGLPTHKGLRPRVTILTTLDSALDVARAHGEGPCPGMPAGGILNRSSGSPSAPRDGEPITAGTLARILCDAVVEAAITDPDGRVLTLGRQHRTTPARLRKAIEIRDQHCRFAGCSAPPTWCEAHHLTPWSQGGTTDPENLALLCVFHHHEVHDRGYQLVWDPDGIQLHTHHPSGRRVLVPQDHEVLARHAAR